MDDFSKYPESISERHADADGGNAAKWTPRDAVISFLRDLDSGKIAPTAVVIAFTRDDGGGATTTGWRMSSPDVVHAVGMLSYVQTQIITSACDD